MSSDLASDFLRRKCIGTHKRVGRAIVSPSITVFVMPGYREVPAP